MSGLKAAIRRYAPKPLLKLASASKNGVLDAADVLLGRRDQLIPPRRLRFVGAGDFRATGREFLEHFRKLGGLRPEHHVLDVGSGIGRMAVPLTEYLTADGRYEGFDIVPHGVAWCQEHISARFRNFGFQLVDIRNKEYNPTGRVAAAEFRFPYSAESFDFAFLTSVFTHMLPTEVDNYLSELHRVLRPDGVCLITWFLLNAESEALLLDGKATIDFRHQWAGCRVVNPLVPEEAVAYQETDAIEAYRRHGLELCWPIHNGSWCGRPDFVSFQDICVARKLATE